MDDEDYETEAVIEGSDEAAGCKYTITLGIRTRREASDGVFTVDLECLNQIKISDTCGIQEFIWELHGRLSESDRESFTWRLESEGVPLAACIETTALIFDDLYSVDDENAAVNADASLVIEVHTETDASAVILIYDYDDDSDYSTTETETERETLEDDSDLDSDSEMEEEYSSLCMRARPASREAVEALEKVRVGPTEMETTCMVCMDDFSSVGSSSEVIKMPCGHVFHGDCILTWLQTSSDCPLCRHRLPSTLPHH